MRSNTISQGIPTGSTDVGNADVVISIVGAALDAPPTLKPYRPDGTLYPFAEQRDGRYREVTNPLGLAAVKNEDKTQRMLGMVYGEAIAGRALHTGRRSMWICKAAFATIIRPGTLLPPRI